jgi:hypothetical protein
LDIDTQGYQNLSYEVVALLRAYKTDIENSIALESYKSSFSRSHALVSMPLT